MEKVAELSAKGQQLVSDLPCFRMRSLMSTGKDMDSTILLQKKRFVLVWCFIPTKRRGTFCILFALGIFVCVFHCVSVHQGVVCLCLGWFLGLFFCQCIMSCLKDWILGPVCKKEVASGSQRKLEPVKFLSRVWPKDFPNTSLYNVNCEGWFFPHFLASHFSVSLHHTKEPLLVLQCSMELYIGCPS